MDDDMFVVAVWHRLELRAWASASPLIMTCLHGQRRPCAACPSWDCSAASSAASAAAGADDAMAICTVVGTVVKMTLVEGSPPLMSCVTKAKRALKTAGHQAGANAQQRRTVQNLEIQKRF